MKQPKLQHLVLISFLEECTPAIVAEVIQAAEALKKIPVVEALQCVENISPEGLDKGYTHCLTLTFDSEKARDEVYLPHPIHQDFVDFFVPKTKSVLVFDYWQ